MVEMSVPTVLMISAEVKPSCPSKRRNTGETAVSVRWEMSHLSSAEIAIAQLQEIGPFPDDCWGGLAMSAALLVPVEFSDVSRSRSELPSVTNIRQEASLCFVVVS